MSIWNSLESHLSKSSRRKARAKGRRNHSAQLGFQSSIEQLETRALLSAVAGDFNHDGVADVAISVPHQTVNGISDAGSIQITYGTRYIGKFKLRLTPPVTATITEASIGGTITSGDEFGSSLAVGDFNGDGIMDLAIGVPGKTVSGQAGAGAVYILFGSRAGLKTTGAQLWTQDSSNILGVAEAGDHFGAALAVGDFNGDRHADLAIGAPDDDVGAVVDAGAVNVIYGSSTGLKSVNNQLFDQAMAGIVGALGTGDHYGAALAAGDFNADGFQDLAIGSPGQSVSGHTGAGGVGVLYSTRGGLVAANSQFWTESTSNMLGTVNDDANFGFSLAAADFNGDSRADLAIGAPGENTNAATDSGAVHILFGSSSRLTITKNQLWNADTDSLSAAASGDGFGAALVAGQFNADHVADLAIGIPNLSISATNEGAVLKLPGVRGTGLSTTNSTIFDRDNPAFGSPTGEDHVGASLAAGDLNGDGVTDLVMGVPANDDTVAAAGNSIWVFNQASSTTPLGVKLADGVEYEILTPGSGSHPTASSHVTVNYVGTLLNGTVFDSSAAHGRAQTFTAGGVIPGFAEALLGMVPNAEWRVYIPSDLAYGPTGQGNVGPNEDLIFDLQMVSFS